MKEALLYKKLSENKVRCDLCNHRCVIKEGERGVCGVRENRKGTLYTLVYGKAIANHIDPIEKKPFFHFLPGSLSYSIATVGCNFTCLHCQNAEISQYPKEHDGEIVGFDLSPEQIVKEAKDNGCKSISYTYTEPTIFFEYALDTMKLAKEEGMKNIFITNGFMSKEAIDMMQPYLDAANIDLKSYSEKFYHTVCGGRLKPVLENMEYMKKKGIWVEVTTLVIPGMNDDPMQIISIAQFIKDIDPGIPWHISRFYPAYKLQEVLPTPAKTLINIRQMGLQVGLRYVYLGNVPGEGDGENTYCYNCHKLLIKRTGFSVFENHIKDGKCPFCGAKIDIVEK
ncbi:MAG: AmmeMemoRadiSam system radical SAM enzyme [Deltaproteobacteria bacterium]|nr:AmmeMemoRadiSam system radical SAM enzyme [Deltaproteobacteria bacterium]